VDSPVDSRFHISLHRIWQLCYIEKALDLEEGAVAGEIVAGYSQQESLQCLGVGSEQFRKLKQVVRNKAIEYLA
jgi:hypothetical protein